MFRSPLENGVQPAIEAPPSEGALDDPADSDRNELAIDAAGEAEKRDALVFGMFREWLMMGFGVMAGS